MTSNTPFSFSAPAPPDLRFPPARSARSRRECLGQLAWLLVAAGCHSSSSPSHGTGGEDGATAATEIEIGPLLAPADLAARIADVASGKIVVLYIGPDILFAKGHIPGARNIGAASSDEGKRAIDQALTSAAPTAEIVLYCGCCPVKSCPNVRPASAALRARGRANARVLDLPTRFATDWADKGFPVERA